MILLDTCAVIDLFRKTAKLKDDSIAITQISVFELFIGPYTTQNKRELRQLKDFLNSITILNSNFELAAQLFVQLRNKGKEIPKNDCLIASCALEHGLELVTSDSHFAQVPKLKVVKY